MADPLLFDLPWRAVLEMTGRDRVRFLHGMCTNDIKTLLPSQGCMAAVVNRQGKMIAEIIVRATESALLLEIDRSNLQPTIDALGKFLVADDVTMKPVDLAVMGIYGPRSREILGVGDMPLFHFVRHDDLLISSDPTLAGPGYHLLVPPSRVEGILKDVPRLSEETYEALRIENGFPRWGRDMDSTMLPMEAGMEPIAISYTKGCYIGQEVIQRVKTYSEPPRQLVQLRLEGATVPSPKSNILSGSNVIGAVTSAALSLRTGKSTALGQVRKEQTKEGTEVAIEPGLKARMAGLPWHAFLKA